MSYVERLLALGATSVGGDLYLKHTHLGSSRNGDFLISPAGLALLGHALPAFALESSALTAAPVVQVPSQDEPELPVSPDQSPTPEALPEPQPELFAAERRTRGRPKKQTPAVVDYAAGTSVEIEI